MARVTRCRVCKEHEAEWSVQYVASDEPSISAIGWHYRGFRMVKVCNACAEKVRSGEYTYENLFDLPGARARTT